MISPLATQVVPQQQPQPQQVVPQQTQGEAGLLAAGVATSPQAPPRQEMSELEQTTMDVQPEAEQTITESVTTTTMNEEELTSTASASSTLPEVMEEGEGKKSVVEIPKDPAQKLILDRTHNVNEIVSSERKYYSSSTLFFLLVFSGKVFSTFFFC